MANIFGGLGKTSAAKQQSRVHAQRAKRPDLAGATAVSAEQLVQTAVDIGDDRKWNRQVVAVSSESFRCGKGGNDDVGVRELVEVIAHGDHMFLTRQSSKVSMEYQYQRAASLVGGTPDLPVVIDEFDIGKQIADTQRHVRVPTT